MPEYTPTHSISYPLPVDRVKDSNFAAKLTEDIKATALTADAGITAASQQIKDDIRNPKLIPSGSDLNNIREPGLYYSPRVAHSNTLTNLPPQIDTPGTFLLDVSVNPGQDLELVTQVYHGIGFTVTSGSFIRYPMSISSTSFTQWYTLVNPAAPETPSGAQNHVWQQAMWDEYGPIYTGGLGAFALRIDHGLANFNEYVRPKLEEHDIPYALALNPGDWDHSENTGVTPAMVNSWIENSPMRVEIINHGMHHNDADTPQKLHEYIVESKHLLESQLPAAKGKIFGFCQPGVGGTEYMGLDAGRTYEGMANTNAGQLVFAHHAYMTGHLQINGTITSQRDLHGRIRNGLGHNVWDAQDAARVKGWVNTTAGTGRGRQTMLHPSRINTTGYITAAEVAEIIDHMAHMRDSEQIKMLSPYELILADSRS